MVMVLLFQGKVFGLKKRKGKRGLGRMFVFCSFGEKVSIQRLETRCARKSRNRRNVLSIEPWFSQKFMNKFNMKLCNPCDAHIQKGERLSNAQCPQKDK